MSDQVEVPFGDNPSDQAVLLLAAAEDLGLDADVVRTAEGAFVVSQEVHDKAFPPKKSSKKSKSEED
jgi:hypothetical protein